MSPLVKIAISSLVIIVIGVILASDQLKGALGGLSDNSAGLIASITIIAAGILFIGKQIADIALALFRETIPPIDRVSVFLDDVEFQLPIIPDTLIHKVVDDYELRNLKSKFSLEETLILTDEEAKEINSKAVESDILIEVISGHPYKLHFVFSYFIENPLYYGQRYLKSCKQIEEWIDYLLLKRERKEGDSSTILKEFLTKEMPKAGYDYVCEIFQRIIELIANSHIVAMQEITQNNVTNFITLETMQVPEIPENIMVDDKIRMIDMIAIKIGSRYYRLGEYSPMAQEAANKFVNILQNENIEGIINVFKQAKEKNKCHGGEMHDYVKNWNDALEKRQSMSMILTATLSNLGRFDSFVLSKGKVAIGHKGDQTSVLSEHKAATRHESDKTPIVFFTEEYIETAPQLEKLRYISVESRKAKTVKFIARLGETDGGRVRSVYESGLGYVRFGLLVSSGEQEAEIVSPCTPFSTEARKQHDLIIEDMQIRI